MSNTSIPPLPQLPVPPTAGQATPPPVSFQPDGGPLGRAALGALKGAEDAQNPPVYLDDQGNPIKPTTQSTSTYLDEHGNPTPALSPEMQRIAESGAAGVTPGGEMGVGVVKGVLQTADTISHIFHPGSKTALESELTTPVSGQEEAGNILENIVEFVAGDEALKGVSLADKLGIAQKIAKFAEESPKLATALKIGMKAAGTATRQAVVGGTQTLAKGGTPAQAVENAAITGGVGGVLEGGAGTAQAIYKSIIKGSPEAVAAAKEAAVKQGSRLAEDIAGKNVSSAHEVTTDVSDQIAKARDQMHADYDQGVYALGEKVRAAGGVLVKTADSPLQKMAVQLSSDSELPVEMEEAMKGLVPDTARLDPVLKELSAGKTYTWDEVEAIRKKFGDTIRKLPWDNPIRKDLIDIRGSIDDTMEQAARDAKHPEIADEMESIRSVYANKVHAFDTTAIKTLSDKNPDAVAKVLLNKGDTIFRVDTLRQLIGQPNMRVVEGSILKNLIDTSSVTPKEGTIAEFNPMDFIKRFNTLGPDVQHTIWGNNLPQIKELLNVAANIPEGNPVWSKLGAYMSHRAYFDVALSGTALFTGYAMHHMEGPAMILGAVLMLHNPELINYTAKVLRGAAKAIPPAVSGIAASQNAAPQPNAESENMPILFEGHSHIKTSDGKEYYIPTEHLDMARQYDKGLQLLRQAGTPNPAQG